MRRMVARRSDSDCGRKWRRARVRSAAIEPRQQAELNLAPAGFVSPVSCGRKQPSGASHISLERRRGVWRLFVGVMRGPGFACTALCPPDAPPRKKRRAAGQHQSVSSRPALNLSEAQSAPGGESHTKTSQACCPGQLVDSHGRGVAELGGHGLPARRGRTLAQ